MLSVAEMTANAINIAELILQIGYDRRLGSQPPLTRFQSTMNRKLISPRKTSRFTLPADKAGVIDYCRRQETIFGPIGIIVQSLEIFEN